MAMSRWILCKKTNRWKDNKENLYKVGHVHECNKSNQFFSSFFFYRVKKTHTGSLLIHIITHFNRFHRIQIKLIENYSNSDRKVKFIYWLQNTAGKTYT